MSAGRGRDGRDDSCQGKRDVSKALFPASFGSLFRQVVPRDVHNQGDRCSFRRAVRGYCGYSCSVQFPPRRTMSSPLVRETELALNARPLGALLEGCGEEYSADLLWNLDRIDQIGPRLDGTFDRLTAERDRWSTSWTPACSIPTTNSRPRTARACCRIRYQRFRDHRHVVIPQRDKARSRATRASTS